MQFQAVLVAGQTILERRVHGVETLLARLLQNLQMFGNIVLGDAQAVGNGVYAKLLDSATVESCAWDSIRRAPSAQTWNVFRSRRNF